MDVLASKIRSMEIADLDAVVNLENKAFARPFTRGLFEKFLEQSAFFGVVAEVGGTIAGFALYSIAADESDLLDIAVTENLRRRGVALGLMNHMIKHLKERAVKEFFLEVRPSNMSARKFYEKIGFNHIGVRPGYYHDTGEDALVYSKVI